MSSKYKINWLQLLIKDRLNQIVDLNDLSSVLRVLQIFVATGLNEAGRLYHHASKISFKTIEKNKEYQFLEHPTKFKLIIDRFRNPLLNSIDTPEFERICSLLTKLIFFKDDDKSKLPTDDTHDAHGPISQMM